MGGIKSNKILYWIIAFLVVTNVTTVGSIAYYNEKFERNDRWKHKRKYQFRHQRSENRGRVSRMFAKRLDLSEEQTANFQEFHCDFNQKAKRLIYEMHLERKKFLDALAQNPVDTVKAEEIASEIGSLHQQMKIETMNLYLKMNAECKLEQRKKLVKIFDQLIRRSEFRGRPIKKRGQKERGRKQYRNNKRIIN